MDALKDFFTRGIVTFVTYNNVNTAICELYTCVTDNCYRMIKYADETSNNFEVYKDIEEALIEFIAYNKLHNAYISDCGSFDNINRFTFYHNESELHHDMRCKRLQLDCQLVTVDTKTAYSFISNVNLCKRCIMHDEDHRSVLFRYAMWLKLKSEIER